MHTEPTRNNRHAAGTQHAHTCTPIALVQAKVPLDLLAAEQARAAQAQQVNVQVVRHQAVLDWVLAGAPGKSNPRASA